MAMDIYIKKTYLTQQQILLNDKFSFKTSMLVK